MIALDASESYCRVQCLAIHGSGPRWPEFAASRRFRIYLSDSGLVRPL